MEKERPSWHVDLKWLFGIFSVVLLYFVLIFSALYFLTSKKIGMPIMTNAVASMYSPKGLDDPGDIEKVRADLLASGAPEYKPFPKMSLTVPRNDVFTKTPRELRLQIFSQIVEPIYTGKLPPEIANNIQAQEQFKNDTTLLRVISGRSHSIVGFILLAFSTLFAITFSISVLFSRRFGRLVTVGVIFSFTTFLPTLFWSFAKLVQKTQGIQAPKILPQKERADELLANTMPTLTDLVLKIYLSVFLAGIAALFIALIAKLITNGKKNK